MLISSILSLLSSSAVTTRRDKCIIYARSTITPLIISFISILNGYYPEFQDKALGIYHGILHITPPTHIFSLFIVIISILILQLNSFYSRKVWTEKFSSIYKLMFCRLIFYNNFILNKMAEQYRILEYPIIILFVIIGGILLMSCSNLISVFLCIELQSYALYVICSLYRKSEKAISAGLTYFLLGGLSSCFILLASGLIYSNSGNVNFDGLYIINSIGNDNNNQFVMYDSTLQSYYINFALTIMSIGFLFKVTAAPFHFWSPDVYDAIPTVVTTFVAIFAKISIFILLFHLVNYIGYSIVKTENDNVINTMFNFSWTFTFLISSLLSMLIGSILGLTQFRIKRLYAYSTINHIGFILLALTINTIESIQSFFFYLLQYSLTNLNAFMLLIAIGISLYMHVEKKDNNTSFIISDLKNSPLQLISQLKGYFHINPAIAVSLALTLFSFVGIPPLVGFFAKQMVLSSALDSGYIFLTIIAILTSVISAYYYLSLVKQIFFSPSDYLISPQMKNVTVKGTINNISNKDNNTSFIINNKNIVLSSHMSITIAFITLIILLFILSPQEWLSIANILALILYNY
uniref:NADH-ubiquinone oxidoreductase chain 2 n=1 Tax=Arthonia kermesina TaxID=2563723 RepID=A0A4P8VTU7_9PEZI|nr:NADH dehydrogenase subunit 2 [Arthonia kermesina]